MMRTLRVLPLISLAVASTVASLRAQEPVTIARLEAFRDSLADSTDPGSINRLTRSQQSDPIAGLRAGLAQLRLAQLSDGRLFTEARDQFRRVGEGEPAWAYPQFGIGLAELGRGRWLAANPAELGNRVGYGSYFAALKAFSRALRIDPRFVAPGVELAALAQELRDTLVVAEALTALRPLAASDSVATDLLLAAGRLERDGGDYAAAVVLYRRVRARGTSSLADLEAARSLLALGQPAESLYYSAAASEDSTVRAEIRADLAPIAEESELALYDGLNGADRVDWLNRFWVERDRRELRSPGERLAEHYRRLYYSRRHFALRVNRRYYTSVDLFRDLAADLDDRGVIYLRHGEPDERLVAPIFALNPNETWVYHQPGGDLVLHFGAGGRGDQGGAVDDYRMVSSVLDLWRPGAPGDLLLLSRASISPLYQHMLAWGAYGQARALAEERELVERSAEVGVSTDGYRLRYRRALIAEVQLLVTGRPGASQLHLVFGLPFDSTGRDPVRIRLGLFDAAMNSVAAFDTTVSAAGVGHVIWPAPAGRWVYRLAIERGYAGKVFPTDSIVVPDAATLGLSDLALAAPGAGIVWEPVPGDSALLSPYQGYQRNSSIEVYYEVYGLTPGRQYETTIAVLERRGARAERQKLDLTFREPSSGAVNRLHRTVRLEGLKKGSYWLEVRVRDEGGAEQSVRRTFRIQ